MNKYWIFMCNGEVSSAYAQIGDNFISVSVTSPIWINHYEVEGIVPEDVVKCTEDDFLEVYYRARTQLDSLIKKNML